MKSKSKKPKKPRTASSYQKKLLRLVDEYSAVTGQTDVDLREVAAWAVETERYVPSPADPVRQLAKEMQQASRQEYVLDDNGEPVRRRHSWKARIGDVQHALWSKIEVISRRHMQMAAAGRRRSILASCVQLHRDLTHYNQKFNPGDALQPSFNFEPDIEEDRLPAEYIDEMPPEEGQTDA